MSKLVNPYTANNLEPGDVMCATVKLMVGHHRDEDGKPYYTLYRCPYPDARIGWDGTPQGDKIHFDREEVTQALFPIASRLGMKPAP